MLYALSWSVVFILLALWSLAAWAFHSIAAWTVSNADVLAGGSVAIEGLRAPDWLALWIPPAISLSVTFGLIAGGVLVSLWKTRGQPVVEPA